MKFKNEVLQLAFDLKNNFDQLFREREYTNRANQLAFEIDEMSNAKGRKE